MRAEVVERVLSQEINPEIVKMIESLGAGRAIRGSSIFTCRKIWLTGPAPGMLDLGYVGDVTSVNVEPLRECIRRGITPVVSLDGALARMGRFTIATPTSGRRKRRQFPPPRGG